MINISKIAETKEFKNFLQNEIDAQLFIDLANMPENKNISERLHKCADKLISKNMKKLNYYEK